MASPKTLEWSMGFRNHQSQLYLTQESFGFRVNCNGASEGRRRAAGVLRPPSGNYGAGARVQKAFLLHVPARPRPCHWLAGRRRRRRARPDALP